MNRLGLKTLIIGFIFWYGFSFLNAAVTDNQNHYWTTYVICLFFIVMLIGYFLGYVVIKKKYQQPVNYQDYNVGTRTFTLISIIFCLSGFLMLYGGTGMFGYHSVRVVTAIGIMAYVYALLFSGWKRILLLMFFVIVVIFMLGVYSRRPFLTLVAPLLLVPFIRNRYKLGKMWMLSIALVALGFVSVLYVTGIRYIDDTVSMLDIVSLVRQGTFVLLSGEGFDTIHLTSFVLEHYDSSSYLNGETFWGGLLNFIPRSIWQDKPIAFGIILSSEFYNIPLNEIFTNFGPGIVAEAYANGGFVSVIIVAACFGFIVGLADRFVENGRYNWNVVFFGIVFYPAVFFMVRGDFVNSFYEFYSKASVIWIVTAVLGLRQRLRPQTVR